MPRLTTRVVRPRCAAGLGREYARSRLGAMRFRRQDQRAVGTLGASPWGLTWTANRGVWRRGPRRLARILPGAPTWHRRGGVDDGGLFRDFWRRDGTARWRGEARIRCASTQARIPGGGADRSKEQRSKSFHGNKVVTASLDRGRAGGSKPQLLSLPTFSVGTGTPATQRLVR